MVPGVDPRRATDLDALGGAIRTNGATRRARGLLSHI